MKPSEQPICSTLQSFEELAEFITVSKIRKNGDGDSFYGDKEKSDMIENIETISAVLKECDVKPNSPVLKNMANSFPRALGIRQTFIDLLNAELTRAQESENNLKDAARRVTDVQQVVLTRQQLAKNVA